MKTLVIGGSRFVGLRLVWELTGQGHEVCVLNRGTTPAPLPQGIERITCDRKDPTALRKALSKREFDAVFDIIAYVPDDTKPLVEILDGKVGKFVHVSTGSVYKSQNVFPWKEHFDKVTDNSEGEYGYQKQLIEEVLFAAYHRSGFPAVMIRPGVIYGPHNNVYRESMLFDRIVKGRPVLVPGDGTYLTQFGYVDDLARLLVLAARSECSSGQAYNFAGEYAYPMNDYVEMLFEAGGKPVQMMHFAPEKVGLSIKEVSKVFPFRFRTHTVRDISKAIYELGYAEQMSLREGLKHSYRWYIEHQIERTDIDFSLEDRIMASV